MAPSPETRCRQLATTPIYSDVMKFRNVIAFVVALGSLGAAPAAGNEVPAEVLDLSVQLHGEEQVRIEFRPSVTEAGYAVYRRAQPIRTAEDLEDAIRVGITTGRNTVRFDAPPPGLPYYYAVIALDRLDRGEEQLVPGRNRTVTPVTIELVRRDTTPRAPQRPELRRVPLPELLVIPELESGATIDTAPFELGAAGPLADELKPAFKTLRAAAPSSPTEPPPEPRLLAPERSRIAEHEKSREATLARVVRGRFEREEWSEAEGELRSLATVLEEDATRARALYYLGLSLYFQERYHESFMSFLQAEPELYREVQPWLTRILRSEHLRSER